MEREGERGEEEEYSSSSSSSRRIRRSEGGHVSMHTDTTKENTFYCENTFCR